MYYKKNFLDKNSFLIEIEKSIIAYNELKSNTELIVPKIVDVDYFKKTIFFEYINNFIPLERISIDNPDVYYRVGFILNKIHDIKTSLLNNKILLSEDKYIVDNKELVFIHGDFSVRNVGIIKDGLNRGPLLCVVDWSTTKLNGGLATIGSRFFDIAWFLNNIYNQKSRYQIDFNFANNICNNFLKGYNHNGSLDKSSFIGYIDKFVSHYVETRISSMSPIKKIFVKRSLGGFYRFIKNYKIVHGL